MQEGRPVQDSKEILKQVKKLEITTHGLTEGLLAGSYHSVFRGSGIEFSEIREYRPGDDIRAIDWKVTARFNRPFLKEFIEERDLQVYFAVDVSASGNFGTETSKKRKAIELAASLMFAALRSNDSIGLFLFTDQIEKFVPARKGRKHVLKLLSILLSYAPKSRVTDLENSLGSIAKIVKRKSIIFLISDFYAEDFSKPLHILKERHDLIALRLLDPRELEIPDVGMIELEDEETGEQILVDSSDPGFRKRYEELVAEHEDKLKTHFRKMKIDLVNVRSDEAYELPLKKFFALRKRKQAR
jgi:uncharacterized protein (DUF58 family)